MVQWTNGKYDKKGIREFVIRLIDTVLEQAGKA